MSDRRTAAAIRVLTDLLGTVTVGTVTLDDASYIALPPAVLERMLGLLTGTGTHARFRAGDRFIMDGKPVTIKYPGIDECGQVCVTRPDGFSFRVTPKPGRFRKIRKESTDV